MTKPPEAEALLEDRVVEYVASLGGVALKLKHDGSQPLLGFPTRGIPDRLILLPNGESLWLELKAPGGKLSEHQKKWIKSLTGQQQRSFHSDDFGAIKDVLDAMARVKSATLIVGTL